MAITDHLTLEAAAEPVNVHLTAGRWEASCPGCGYLLAWAAQQDTLDLMTTRLVACPVCREDT